MIQTNLRRAITLLEAEKPLTKPLRDYVLAILHKRVKPEKRGRSVFKSALLPVPKLKRELDRVFSLYVRQRDWYLEPITYGQIVGGSPGLGRCATCGFGFADWRQSQCGHYVPRQDINTRWDEKNAHAQCGSCNGFRGGKPEEMAKYIDKKYGAGTAEFLQAKSKIKIKLDRHKLQLWIQHYETQLMVHGWENK